MRSRRRSIRRLLPLALCLLATGCGGRDAGPLHVTVSIPPLAWLTERLAGPTCTVDVALPPGESPAVFDPTPRRLVELSATDLYFAVGVPMERILLPHLREACPDLVVADLAGDLPRHADDAHAHAHAHAHDGHGHAHDHDPHVWLSPRMMARMAATAATALSEHLPAQADDIRANLATLESELATLDADLAAILAPAGGGRMLVYHPAFGHLARDYGFDQVAVERGGLPPSPRHLAEVLDGLGEAGTRTLFVQPRSAGGPLRALAEAEGLRLAELDPLARDYPDNLRRMARAIAAALAGSETP